MQNLTRANREPFARWPDEHLGSLVMVARTHAQVCRMSWWKARMSASHAELNEWDPPSGVGSWLPPSVRS